MLTSFLNLRRDILLSFHKEEYLADFHLMFISADLARQTVSMNYIL